MVVRIYKGQYYVFHTNKDGLVISGLDYSLAYEAIIWGVRIYNG